MLFYWRKLQMLINQGEFMKRFHIHIGVDNLNDSIEFYSTMFGLGPTKLKDDYAKWMLEDPKINFAISTRVKTLGLDHLGLQFDHPQELSEINERLKNANIGVYDEGAATCCYAKSEKAWMKDPSGISWEVYHTMEDADVFHEVKVSSTKTCCPPNFTNTKSSCC